MDEELKEMAAVYAKMAENLTARWPNGIEKLNGRDYRPAVSDLAIAGTLEMVAKGFAEGTGSSRGRWKVSEL